MTVLVDSTLSRVHAGSLALMLCAGAPLHAQAAAATAPRHPTVCAAAVHIYGTRSELPTPFDSLAMLPGPPIRISSREEAAAAEMQRRERAGKAGATGVLVADETTNNGGLVRVRRRVLPLFAASDSARAQQACKAP